MSGNDEKDIRELKEFLVSCRIQRLEQLEKEFEGSKEYADLARREHELCELLETALADMLKPLLRQCRDTFSEILVMQEEFYYRRGFMDGYRLAEMVEGRGQRNVRMDVHIV